MRFNANLLKDVLKGAPGVKWLLDRRNYRRFLSQTFGYYGVFADFNEARRRLPPSSEYNKPELADEYENVRMHRVFPYDYPVMYWMNQAFTRGATNVFDLGGSVGVHFHAYKKFMQFPRELSWQVCEVPEIAHIGQQIAARRNTPELAFTDKLDVSDVRADIWISAGALQYIEHGQLERLLPMCGKKPRHILLNKLPVYDGEPFVTAQNIGEGSFSPQYVYNRQRLIEQMAGFGYRLVDSWRVLERELYLPGHPERSFSAFTGMYFTSAVTQVLPFPLPEITYAANLS